MMTTCSGRFFGGRRKIKICIHRGTRQIGGTCVEIDEAGQRLIIDLGLPLDADEPSSDLLPSAAGLTSPDRSLQAIVISHAHLDHYGLLPFVHAEIPVMVGEYGLAIMRAADPFVPHAHVPEHTILMHDRRTLHAGPFQITPYLVDHSAYDAYALLVESPTGRLFYSGDFRGHGRKAGLFDRMLRHPPRNIDALLLEGSSLGRLSSTAERFPTEAEIEERLVHLLQQTRGLALVTASGQNIDRVVSIFKATRKTGRQLVLDLYAAEILRATGNPRIPQGTWAGVRVFTPEWQRRIVKRKEMFEVLDRYRANRIFPEELAREASRCTLLFRNSMRVDLERAGALAHARLIYSMWEGYLTDGSQKSLLEWKDRHQIPMDVVHTSGHASIADLKRFATAIAPKAVVPIHTFHRSSFKKHFSNVVELDDGEWWTISRPTQVGKPKEKNAQEKDRAMTIDLDQPFLRMFGTDPRPNGYVSRLKGTSAWPKLEMRLRNGEMFAAVRENELHFYAGGGRAVRRTRDAFYTNDWYLNGGREPGQKSRDVRIKEELLSELGKIIQNCRNKRRSDSETVLAAKLYDQYSFMKDGTQMAGPLLVDVEIRFAKEGTGVGPKHSDKIDAAFWLPGNRLMFVEIKRRHDGRVRSTVGKPEVLKQVSYYRAQIDARKDEILAAYRDVISVFRELIGTGVPNLAFDKIVPEVPLLVFDESGKPADKPQKGSDTWLEPELDHGKAIWAKDGVIVIDGRGKENMKCLGDLLVQAADRC